MSSVKGHTIKSGTFQCLNNGPPVRHVTLRRVLRHGVEVKAGNGRMYYDVGDGNLYLSADLRARVRVRIDGKGVHDE